MVSCNPPVCFQQESFKGTLHVRQHYHNLNIVLFRSFLQLFFWLVASPFKRCLNFCLSTVIPKKLEQVRNYPVNSDRLKR